MTPTLNLGLLLLSLPGVGGGELETTPLPAYVRAARTESESRSALSRALTEGEVKLSFRYRAEIVEDDAFAEDSFASTLRTALGYRTAPYHGFQAFLEFEDITRIGDDNYNDTVNGEVDHGVVADPETTEVNQAYMDYGHDGLDVRVGRQEIVLDDARFIGNVAWRQNHQSFDAARLTYRGLESFVFDYAYLHRVNRIFGSDNPRGDDDTGAHLVNIAHDIEGIGKASAYAYLLEFDEARGVSTSTYGARLVGSRPLTDNLGVAYHGELASQVDYGDNPLDVREQYSRAELEAVFPSASVTLGHEMLGGSGATGDKFTTPLATAHAFNGFADLFLNTPDTGLEDLYLTLKGTAGAAKWRATYHDFSSDSGGIDYGSEVDLDVAYKLNDQVTLGIRFARFDSDEAFADTTKVMGWVSFAAL